MKKVYEFSLSIDGSELNYLESNVYAIAENHAKVTSFGDDNNNYISSIEVITDKDDNGNAAESKIIVNFDIEDEHDEKTTLSFVGAQEFYEFIELIGIYALSQGYLDRHINAINSALNVSMDEVNLAVKH